MSTYGLNNTNLFVYCQNNPVCRKDSGGTFANWAIGAIVGGLVGGIVSAAQGGSFWAGVAQGAVSGAIAGFAVDAALAVAATGGLAAIAVGGIIAGAGGALGSLAGDDIASIISTGKPAPVDNTRVCKAAACGIINICSFGFSSLLRAADVGLKATGSGRPLVDLAKNT